VQDLLALHNLKSELITFETKGDKILDRSLSKIGSKGLFTEELELSLLQGTSHIAVHSAKDLPSALASELEIIAFTQRESIQDVLVSGKAIDLNSSLKVGSSSTRRIALLKKYYPNWQIVPMRGNLQTRIKKMEFGDCDALMLAYAGVYRMGFSSMIRHHFAVDTIIPPVGQGALALEASIHLDSKLREQIIRCTNHLPTETCLLAERSFLKVMEGGCSVPIFAIAQLAEDSLQLKGGIISLDGTMQLIDFEAGLPSEAIEIGERLAKKILANGGKELLKDIKQQV
jgi:hydroxymethylbilane synthase